MLAPAGAAVERSDRLVAPATSIPLSTSPPDAPRRRRRGAPPQELDDSRERSCSPLHILQKLLRRPGEKQSLPAPIREREGVTPPLSAPLSLHSDEVPEHEGEAWKPERRTPTPVEQPPPPARCTATHKKPVIPAPLQENSEAANHPPSGKTTIATITTEDGVAITAPARSSRVVVVSRRINKNGRNTDTSVLAIPSCGPSGSSPPESGSPATVSSSSAGGEMVVPPPPPTAALQGVCHMVPVTMRTLTPNMDFDFPGATVNSDGHSRSTSHGSVTDDVPLHSSASNQLPYVCRVCDSNPMAMAVNDSSARGLCVSVINELDTQEQHDDAAGSSSSIRPPSAPQQPFGDEETRQRVIHFTRPGSDDAPKAIVPAPPPHPQPPIVVLHNSPSRQTGAASAHEGQPQPQPPKAPSAAAVFSSTRRASLQPQVSGSSLGQEVGSPLFGSPTAFHRVSVSFVQNSSTDPGAIISGSRHIPAILITKLSQRTPPPAPALYPTNHNNSSFNAAALVHGPSSLLDQELSLDPQLLGIWASGISSPGLCSSSEASPFGQSPADNVDFFFFGATHEPKQDSGEAVGDPQLSSSHGAKQLSHESRRRAGAGSHSPQQQQQQQVPLQQVQYAGCYDDVTFSPATMSRAATASTLNSPMHSQQQEHGAHAGPRHHPSSRRNSGVSWGSLVAPHPHLGPHRHGTDADGSEKDQFPYAAHFRGDYWSKLLEVVPPMPEFTRFSPSCTMNNAFVSPAASMPSATISMPSAMTYCMDDGLLSQLEEAFQRDLSSALGVPRSAVRVQRPPQITQASAGRSVAKTRDGDGVAHSHRGHSHSHSHSHSRHRHATHRRHPSRQSLHHHSLTPAGGAAPAGNSGGNSPGSGSGSRRRSSVSRQESPLSAGITLRYKLVEEAHSSHPGTNDSSADGGGLSEKPSGASSTSAVRVQDLTPEMVRAAQQESDFTSVWSWYFTALFPRTAPRAVRGITKTRSEDVDAPGFGSGVLLSASRPRFQRRISRSSFFAGVSDADSGARELPRTDGGVASLLSGLQHDTGTADREEDRHFEEEPVWNYEYPTHSVQFEGEHWGWLVAHYPELIRRAFVVDVSSALQLAEEEVVVLSGSPLMHLECEGETPRSPLTQYATGFASHLTSIPSELQRHQQQSLEAIGRSFSSVEERESNTADVHVEERRRTAAGGVSPVGSTGTLPVQGLTPTPPYGAARPDPARIRMVIYYEVRSFERRPSEVMRLVALCEFPSIFRVYYSVRMDEGSSVGRPSRPTLLPASPATTAEGTASNTISAVPAETEMSAFPVPPSTRTEMNPKCTSAISPLHPNSNSHSRQRTQKPSLSPNSSILQRTCPPTPAIISRYNTPLMLDASAPPQRTTNPHSPKCDDDDDDIVVEPHRIHSRFASAPAPAAATTTAGPPADTSRTDEPVLFPPISIIPCDSDTSSSSSFFSASVLWHELRETEEHHHHQQEQRENYSEDKKGSSRSLVRASYQAAHSAPGFTTGQEADASPRTSKIAQSSTSHTVWSELNSSPFPGRASAAASRHSAASFSRSQYLSMPARSSMIHPPTPFTCRPGPSPSTAALLSSPIGSSPLASTTGGNHRRHHSPGAPGTTRRRASVVQSSSAGEVAAISASCRSLTRPMALPNSSAHLTSPSATGSTTDYPNPPGTGGRGSTAATSPITREGSALRHASRHSSHRTNGSPPLVLDHGLRSGRSSPFPIGSSGLFPRAAVGTARSYSPTCFSMTSPVHAMRCPPLLVTQPPVPPLGVVSPPAAATAETGSAAGFPQTDGRSRQTSTCTTPPSTQSAGATTASSNETPATSVSLSPHTGAEPAVFLPCTVRGTGLVHSPALSPTTTTGSQQPSYMLSGGTPSPPHPREHSPVFPSRLAVQRRGVDGEGSGSDTSRNASARRMRRRSDRRVKLRRPLASGTGGAASSFAPLQAQKSVVEVDRDHLLQEGSSSSQEGGPATERRERTAGHRNSPSLRHLRLGDRTPSPCGANVVSPQLAMRLCCQVGENSDSGCPSDVMRPAEATVNSSVLGMLRSAAGGAGTEQRQPGLARGWWRGGRRDRRRQAGLLYVVCGSTERNGDTVSSSFTTNEPKGGGGRRRTYIKRRRNALAQKIDTSKAKGREGMLAALLFFGFFASDRCTRFLIIIIIIIIFLTQLGSFSIENVRFFDPTQPPPPLRTDAMRCDAAEGRYCNLSSGLLRYVHVALHIEERHDGIEVHASK
eukprot:gene2281-1423_t